MNWTVRTATFVLWAAAAASAVYWGLRLGSAGSSVSAPSVGTRQPSADAMAVARVLGEGATPSAAAPAAASFASRFQLLGVVSDASRQGAALIAVEGRPAKPFRVGAVVDQGVVLQSVAPRHAVLADASNGSPLATLEMPLPPTTAQR